MPRETTYSGVLGSLQQLVQVLRANAAELPQLEISRLRFEELVSKALEAAQQQASYAAAKQDATRQLTQFLAEGQRMANVLRVTVKQHYGIRSEKLAEFAIQPFRGRPRKAGPGRGGGGPPPD
jgi:hypothetical protein